MHEWTYRSEPGEVLTYSFESILPEQMFNVILRVSSKSDRKFFVQVDNMPTGKAFLSQGDGWDSFDDYVWPVQLASGSHELKVVFMDGRVNLCSVSVVTA